MALEQYTGSTFDRPTESSEALDRRSALMRDVNSGGGNRFDMQHSDTASQWLPKLELTDPGAQRGGNKDSDGTGPSTKADTASMAPDAGRTPAGEATAPESKQAAQGGEANPAQPASTEKSGEDKTETQPATGDAKSGDRKWSHFQQADKGAGTEDHPVTENCQTNTLKNVFGFYGKADQAGGVVATEEELLNKVKSGDLRGIDTKAFADAVNPNIFDESSERGKQAKESVADTKKEAAKGNLDYRSFVGETELKTADGDSKKGTVVSDEGLLLTLTEMGTKPEVVPFAKGTDEEKDASAAKVTDALKSGKPVLILDHDSIPLSARQQGATGEGAKAQGHVYMVHQSPDGTIQCSDPSDPGRRTIDPQILADKLRDPNSYGIILNAEPDLNKVGKH